MFRKHTEQAEHFGVRAGVAEAAEDVDLAQRGGGEREGDVARAHADEQDLAPGRGGLHHINQRVSTGFYKVWNLERRGRWGG